jgi:hypothetical protein
MLCEVPPRGACAGGCLLESCTRLSEVAQHVPLLTLVMLYDRVDVRESVAVVHVPAAARACTRSKRMHAGEGQDLVM